MTARPLSPAIPYRPDVDGLRAVAVLAVIAYHFHPQSLRAGFVGVDIFFVISGYLISSLILARAGDGSFSLADFYARRVRRIFPALLLVLLASLGLGWLVLYSDEYRLLGRHVAAGAGFLSNFVLWSETGYFDPAAESKPLLHLWSLAVEEQFYVLWPLLLVWVCRGHWMRIGTTVALLLGSLAASLYFTAISQPTAFYLPLFRFWELMAGALLAQLPWTPRSRTGAELRAAAGLLLLAASVALVDPDSPFPGWRAVLPVGAAMLLISAGPGAAFNRAVLSSRPLVAIGLISYPLYLWHWPLLTYYRITANDAPLTATPTLALLAAALLLSWLTYVALERPIRSGGHSATKAWSLAAIMLVVGVLGAGVATQDGLPSRAVNDRDPSFAARDGRNAADVREWTVDDCRLPEAQARLFRRCTRDARGPERYALLGDSKAEALFAGLVRTSTPEGRWLFIGGSTQHDSVLPALSEWDRYSSYSRPARLALEAVRNNEHVETVVLVAAARAFFHLKSASSIEDLPSTPYYPQAFAGLSSYVGALLNGGKRVVLVIDNPTLPDPKRCMTDARVTVPGPVRDLFSIGKADPRCQITLERHNELSAVYHRLLREVQSQTPGRVWIFDPLPYLCDMGQRVCGAFDGQRHLYSFSDHISDYASTKVGHALNEFLSALPPAPPRPGIREATGAGVKAP